MRLSPAEVEQIAKEVEQAKIDYQWKLIMPEVVRDAREDVRGCID
jgi:hypothetical protein